MKIGLLGLFTTDLTDVDHRKMLWAAELGFHGMGLHLNVPAESIADDTVANVVAVAGDVGMELLQLWGAYPCIITPDEAVRRAGVAQVREIAGLAARLGSPAFGVRPTSLNPRFEWWPHPDNFTAETEERFHRSLMEILQAAEDLGLDAVLELHQTTVLNSAARIRRIIERTGSQRLRVNIDPANLVTDIQVAYHPGPMIDELFDLLAPYAATVHVKDVYLEERFLVHISETVIGTGIMDLDRVLRRADRLGPDTYVIIEHLPLSLVPLAKRNLDEIIARLGIAVG